MQCDESSCLVSINTEEEEYNIENFEDLPSNLSSNKICLTQLWEHVVKYKKLPENIDSSIFFTLVNQRLRNPEWEVRQHSLRVLVDIIPVINPDELDTNIEEALNEIVRNLGHIGPAVRKAAIDALKTYVNYTNKPNLIVRELVHKGIEKGAVNKVNPNITLGIIIAVPFLITQKISVDALRYIIHVLLEKLENILHQESIVRSLIRIKGIIGNKKFEEILEAHKLKKDFEMLCELYNLPEKVCDFIPDQNKQFWSDYNLNYFQSKANLNLEEEEGKKAFESVKEVDDKVILETEIKLDEGPAITMKIHEESKHYFDSSDSDCENRGISTFQVLADDSDDDYDSWRKTPKRVRFGGEIVKMRTPDSDSNQQSDETENLNEKLNLKTQSKPLLEIHYKSTTKLSTKLLNKSHIPIPISSKSRPNSEPNSPKRIKSVKLYKSSPNLSKDEGNEGKTKIPMKKKFGQKEISRSIKIKVNQSIKGGKNNRREEHPRKLVRGKTIEVVDDVRGKLKEDKIPALEFKPNMEKQDEVDLSESKNLLMGKVISQEKNVRSLSSMKVMDYQEKNPISLKNLSPRRNLSPNRNTSLSKDFSSVRNLSPRSLSPKSLSPKRNSSPKRNLPPRRDVFPKRNSSPKRNSPPRRNLSPKRNSSPKRNPSPGRNSPPIRNTSSKNFSSIRNSSPTRNLSPPRKPTKNLERYSPIPIHNQIEVFHNLTRSPERKPKPTEEILEQKQPEERHLTTADDVLFGKNPNTNERKIHTADKLQSFDASSHSVSSTEKDSNSERVIVAYNSFHVCNTNESSTLEEFDSPIPVKDSGDCLTCSSSGSDGISEKLICERIGLIDERILHDIQLKNDVVTKKKGLEELLKLLKDPTILDSTSEKLPSLLNILFNAEQQPLLQSISEQTLSYIFGNINEEVILNKIHPIVYNLTRAGSPLGTRLSLIILKRIPSKYLLDCLLSDSILCAKSSKIREGALQILMTITRIFPSTEIDIPTCLNSIVKTLKDKKRKVRQAALETIAALTQLSSTSIVLDVVTKVIQNYTDKERLLRVIRTRLSRKQLPAVDLNGNVRYSTPLGQTELDFLSNSINGEVNESLEERKVVERKTLEVSNGERTNYWVQKKYNMDFNERGLDDIDWNSHEYREDSNKNLQTQIWAIDPGSLYVKSDQVNQINGSLRPVFVIQPDSSQSYESLSNGMRSNKQTNTENIDFRHNRGRSFSPPKKSYDSSLENSIENERVYKNDDTKRNKFYNNERFHKSFSSDQLLPNHKRYLRHSESSSTSGSSMRSNGGWKRDIRSGIPIPINTDGRFKIRTKPNDFKGPLITTQYYNSKLQTPESIPDKFSAQIRPIMAKQPFSSGSESSGYFTPPAEPLLPDIFDQNADAQRSKSSQSERFVRIDTPSNHHENFTVIDSNYCESLKKTKSAPVQHYTSFDSVDFEPVKEFGEVIERISSPEENSFSRRDDYEDDDEDDEEKKLKLVDLELKIKEEVDEEEINQEIDQEIEDEIENEIEDEIEEEIGEKIEEKIIEKYQHKILRRESTINSLEDLDFVANQTFGERKLLSKSEADILTSTEMNRKTINSAPTIKKTYEHFKTFDTPISSTKTSLPGSIVDFQEIEVVQEVIEKTPTKTVCTKRITKQLSRKRSIKTIQTEKQSLAPFTKPKESLADTLNQLDSSEWEVTMRGLQNLTRLVRHHQTIIQANLHPICVSLSKHIKNLRSQVARNACLVASELFKTCKKHIEVEIEELATPLLHRTADTNKFLRSDANAALDDMSINLSPPKVVAVVTSRGSNHQNAIVRCASVRILCALCHRLGVEKIFQLPKETRDKILLTGANMLTEGSLETRKHAKMMLGHLSTHTHFHKAMMEAVPSHIMRHISKSLKTLI